MLFAGHELNAAEIGDIDSYFKEYSDENSFNGSMTISKKNATGYDILYNSGIGGDENIKFDSNTIYDIGSVSKLFTTVAILQLRDEGKLSLDDSISLYLENVPEDKVDITIEQLLTHTSGLFVEENENKDVSKEEEINRILTSQLEFSPGTNYYYSNCGFTLLAAIIEAVSEENFETYIIDNIINPFGLSTTGFVNSTNLNTQYMSSGSMDGVEYGRVDNQPFGWYSKGYTDVLSTSTDLTKFFYNVLNTDTLSTTSKNDFLTKYVDLGNDSYRGIGTSIKVYNGGTYVGHYGVWNTGNTALVYRLEDQTLLVAMTNEVDLGYLYPAEELTKDFFKNYPLDTLSNYPAIDSYDFTKPEVDDEKPVLEKIVNEKDDKKIIILEVIIVIIAIVLLLRIIKK